MLHKTIRKHVSRFHAHIQEHGHKRALIMIMSSMVMMFYPYFSTRADQVTLPSGGTIEIQYSPDDGPVNTDVVATVVVNTASGFDITNNQTLYTYTFTENGNFVFEYEEEGTPGAIMASVNWIDKEAPTATIDYTGDPVTGPVTATMDDSEDTIITSTGNSPAHVFTENGSFLFTFVDAAGNTGSALAEVTTIVPAGNICGNQIVEDLEQCDDGNSDDNDGCTTTCELENDVTQCPVPEDFSVNIYNNDLHIDRYLEDMDYIMSVGISDNIIVGGTIVSAGTAAIADDEFIFELDSYTQLPTVMLAFTDASDNPVCNQITIPVTEPLICWNVDGDLDDTYTTSGAQVTLNWNDYLEQGYDIQISADSGQNSIFVPIDTVGMSSEEFITTSSGYPQKFKFTIIDQDENQICTRTPVVTVTGSMPTTPPTPTLTGITATVSYVSGTTVTATATGFNMTGVFAVNNSNSLSYTFTSPGSFTFALQTAGGNTGSVTATATTGMFTTGSTNTGTNNTGSNNTGSNNTGTVNTGVICDAGDLVLTGALGGVYSLTTPVVVGGLFSINWAAANNHCNPDQIVTIQLRDHNGQWITLGTGELDGTGLAFRSTGLAYTGLYSIFGTHASGSIYTYTGTSGQQLTGTYTVDTPYTIYAAANTGSYTGLWTGYQVRIINASGVDLLSGARPFTIDNTTPSLTGLALLISGANGSGVVGSGGTFTLSFVGSELLSNIQLLVNNTLVKSWTGGSSTGYSFTGGFGATNLAGPIAYTVNFTDAAGNTGSITGTNIYTIDTIDPNFQAFAVTGTAASGVKFSWNTSKNSVYNFQFSLSGSTGVVVPVTTNAYATSHNYTTTALATGKTYMFSIKINDALQNTNFMSGTVAVNASGAASVTIATQNNNVLQLSSQVEAKLFSQILKEEIKKFESCKSDLKFKSTSIELKGTKSINLKIPEMEKSSTKTIVQAFSLMLVNKLKTSNLSASELDETETKVNNFFVILKLLKDDKGDCKQNLSAYYINQFERIMEDMLK